MNQLRITMIAALALALAAPVAATAEPGKGKTKSAEAKSKGKGKAKGKSKPRQGHFKGDVTAVDTATGTVTVLVDKTNKWARSYKGQSVVFTLEGVKKLKVADTNADGAKTIDDIKVGDRAIAGARLAKDADVTAPVAAWKFHAKAPETEDEDEGEDAPAPTTTP